MWFNTLLVVYHGCSDNAVGTLLPNGVNAIDPTVGRLGLDFGRGFYTTTSAQQALRWARMKVKRDRGRPTVIAWRVRRELLATMDTLAFTHYKLNEDFFPFVEYCRGGAETHGRLGSKANFDVVYGPLMATVDNESLRDIVPFTDSDQISFHTPAVNTLLEDPRVVCGTPNLTLEMIMGAVAQPSGQT